ncbi:MAG: thioredoxin-dependent thiol peroxidase [Candidatus Binatus sp.]|uniref:thioredoxin-dependent thiol peroxidase n=1 Tax=Candidatus Binatus sp. TaxID=2811406 RepID=UPI002720BFF3|nr:thioredoxin-dependent thiol peroxidase [Candidatus Binatus sp.]MDO8434258.1 thioredoxin-dependent thiol peroxidase [Candidatus Binatus sp.]
MPTTKKITPKAPLKTSKASSASIKPAAAAGNDSLALEGKKAPNFQLADADGKSIALKDLIGKRNLVLYFYPKDMTPGCTIEACSFRDNDASIRAMGAQIVGISADSSASHVKFRDKHSLNFPLLSDPDNKVTRAYGVYKKKKLYGREFMGIERTTVVIDKSGVVRKVFPKVKVKGHTDEVIAALKSLS